MTTSCVQCNLDKKFLDGIIKNLDEEKKIDKLETAWILDKLDCKRDNYLVPALLSKDEIIPPLNAALHAALHALNKRLQKSCSHKQHNQCFSCQRQYRYWQLHKKQLNDAKKKMIITDSNNLNLQYQYGCMAWVIWYIQYRYGKQSYTFKKILDSSDVKSMQKILFYLDFDTGRECTHNPDYTEMFPFKLAYNSQCLFFNAVLYAFYSLPRLNDKAANDTKKTSTILAALKFITTQAQESSRTLIVKTEQFSGIEMQPQDINAFLQREVETNSFLSSKFAYYMDNSVKKYVIDVGPYADSQQQDYIQSKVNDNTIAIDDNTTKYILIHINRETGHAAQSATQNINIQDNLTTLNSRRYNLNALIVHVRVCNTLGRYICYTKIDFDRWRQYDDNSMKVVRWNTIPMSFVVVCFYSKT